MKCKYLKWTDPRIIEIPEGYRRITHGKVKANDLVYDNTRYRMNGGLVDFRIIDKDYIETKISEWWLIIRKIN